VYAGGDFSTIGGQNRNRIAALDSTTGNATTWNPNAIVSNLNDPDELARAQIFSLALSGTTVYAAGEFTNIGGQSRGNIAALDATTGDATAWNPFVNSTIHSIVMNGTTVYAGGQFSYIGGQSSNYIAAFNATTGNVLTWNPNANDYVYSLAARGSTIYVGGDFTRIGQGVGHPYFAQFGDYNPASSVQPNSSTSNENKTVLKITNFSGSTMRSSAAVKVAYALPKAERVSLRLYSIDGRLQKELIGDKHQDAGNYSLSMHRGSLAAGSYLVVFRAGDFHQEKMIFVMK
jgi:hypothetical protein